MTVVRKCDSHHGGEIGIRKVCQLMEMWYLGKCDSCQKV